ncbi:MAG: formate C-acetyltransferase [Syntrophomonadaceae bacterium]|nr:formate C-acetyltransferase [Syntrophomonadaceae bacterium]
MDSWRGFAPGRWQHDIDVRDFIQKNYVPYTGDSNFLTPLSENNQALWLQCSALREAERLNGGVLKIDTSRPAAIDSHPPAYIDRERELIVGLQTDEPLKRAVNLYGGLRNARQACEAYGCQLDADLDEFFRRHRRTHNDGVFAVYTDEMRQARRAGIITGLPDAYGRGRIIGDYRRVALYGTDRLIRQKERERETMPRAMSPERLRHREELYDCITALTQLQQLGESYGCDLSRPAATAHEAVQWLYMAYLAAVRQQNGAAMSLGRNSAFLDIYIERDMAEGRLDEAGAQELIDQLVMKLRLVRQLRTPEYNELFAGDPNWITESLGGTGIDGRTLVTRTTFRLLHSLENLGAAPEPNLTILWSRHLPPAFMDYCARLSIRTCALQYENDDLMREYYGDDYAIACCVSPMRLGREMQFFGARCNLAKLLLYAINGGRDELSGQQIGPEMTVYPGHTLDYDEVMRRFALQLDWLADLYLNTMNLIHYMHDRYSYESLQMALHDPEPYRWMAFGIAGLSVLLDSLSAIRYARVSAIRDERGLVTGYHTEGDFPTFGNDDDRVDLLAGEVLSMFLERLRQHPAYRHAQPSLSVLTISSNVVYGKKTGSTPDGREKGTPLAPGANPLHGRERHGAMAAMNSVSKIPYRYARDGISYTFSIVPSALGHTEEEQVKNLTALLHGYFAQEGQHINVNVVHLETLKEAMEHPEKYPDLTIRISGYAVHFTRLSREHQEEIIMRTFYQSR